MAIIKHPWSLVLNWILVKEIETSETLRTAASNNLSPMMRLQQHSITVAVAFVKHYVEMYIQPSPSFLIWQFPNKNLRMLTRRL